MSKKNHNQPHTITKREFLESCAAVGGVTAMMTALNGWDMGIASAAEVPPNLTGDSKNTKMLIL